MVTTLQAHVEPRGGDAFGSFQGGYLRLRGKIGLFKHGEPTAWAHTYWDIEDEIEPGSSEFKEDIHMLPISVCQTPKVIRYCSMEIRCLLLQKSSDNSHDYIRVGLFVIRDQEVEAYKEQRWVFDYARAIETDPDSVGPDVITIY